VAFEQGFEREYVVAPAPGPVPGLEELCRTFGGNEVVVVASLAVDICSAAEIGVTPVYTAAAAVDNNLHYRPSHQRKGPSVDQVQLALP
jgi:hypothetical protein